MANFKIIPYSGAYDAQIRALCKLPVSGNISLALEREPEYSVGANIQCNQPEVYVCLDRDSNLVCGVFNIGFRDIYFHTEAKRARYLCDLRIHPDYRGSSLLYRIIQKVKRLNLVEDGIPAQTIVFGDNLNMLNIISRSRHLSNGGHIPTYHFAGKYISTLLGLKQPKQSITDFKIRQATMEDLPDLQNFMDREGRKINYFPIYRLEDLHHDFYRGIHISDYFLAFKAGQLVGICGVWNQKSFKQTRITAYSRSYQLIRPFYNLLAMLRRANTLPPAGSLVNYLYLHTILISDRDPTFFEAIVQVMVNHFRNSTFDYLLCGLAENDPLLAAFDRFKNKRTVAGHYFLVNHSKSVDESLLKDWFYLEASRI